MDTIKSPPAPTQHNDLIIPLDERKTMNTLLPGDCRWPIGDPQHRDFHFCGKPKAEGHPYCDVHMRLGFQTTRPRAVVNGPGDGA